MPPPPPVEPPVPKSELEEIQMQTNQVTDEVSQYLRSILHKQFTLCVVLSIKLELNVKGRMHYSVH